MFNTSEKNAYTKNLDMKKQWFNTNELTRNWSLGRWRRFPKKKNASQNVFFGKILNNTAVYIKILHTILIGL